LNSLFDSFQLLNLKIPDFQGLSRLFDFAITYYKVITLLIGLRYALHNENINILYPITNFANRNRQNSIKILPVRDGSNMLWDY